jgi:hypothetical protein
LAGTIVKRQNQHQAATGLADVGWGVGRRGLGRGCSWGGRLGQDLEVGGPECEQNCKRKEPAEGMGESSYHDGTIIEGEEGCVFAAGFRAGVMYLTNSRDLCH